MIWLLLACSQPDLPPDVLLLTVDTLRADRLGFAGHEGAHTPNLDALAAGGRVFSGATTPLPRTTPALGSLHTGLLPHHHGSREVGEALTTQDTLAARFSAAGWQTLARSAMKVAGPEQGLDVGFDDFAVRHDARASVLAADALEAAAALDRSRSALAWLHFADPHFPYLPPADGPLQPEAPACRKVVRKASKGKLRRAPLFADQGGRASAIVDECAQLYDAEIAAVDAAIGQFLEDWAALRGERDTWVVFTADHGEHLGEAGLFFEHGPDVHDANVRIPLVLSGPGVAADTDLGVARLEDVLPTLGGSLDLDVGAVDGTDLWSDPPALARIESGSALQVPLHGYLVSGRAERFCVNEGPFSWCVRDGVGALHDRRTDPGLDTDVSEQHPELAARLQASPCQPERTRQRAVRSATHVLTSTPLLDGTRARTLTTLDGTPSEDAAVLAHLGEALDAFEAELDRADGPQQADEAQLEALRQLGYVE